jgi:hypothetical protein
MSRSWILALALCVLAAPGCCFGGTTSSTGPVGSAPDPITGGSGSVGACDNVASVSTCRDLSGGAFLLGEDFQRNLCMGTYTSGGGCPADGRVGSCDDGNGQVTRYYSTGGIPYTADSARADCAAIPGNTFTP